MLPAIVVMAPMTASELSSGLMGTSASFFRYSPISSHTKSAIPATIGAQASGLESGRCASWPKPADVTRVPMAATTSANQSIGVSGAVGSRFPNVKIARPIAATPIAVSIAKRSRHGTSAPAIGPSVAAPKSAGTSTVEVSVMRLLPKFSSNGGSTLMKSMPPAKPWATCAASKTGRFGAAALAADATTESAISHQNDWLTLKPIFWRRHPHGAALLQFR